MALEALVACGPAVAAVPKVVKGVTANREQAPLELSELRGRIVRGCRRTQRFWESGMHSNDLGPLEDTVDRAQALYDEALSGMQASNMGIGTWSSEFQTGTWSSEFQTAMKACKWTLGVYTPAMEKVKEEIDHQLDLAQKIASHENLNETMDPAEGAEHWCAWMSVDPRTGDIVPYPRVKARLIEAAWQQQQESVYLGSDFYEATIILKSEEWPHPFQKTPDGARSVQRVSFNSAHGGILFPKIAGEPGNIHFAFPEDEYDQAPFEILPNALVRTPIVGLVRLQRGTKERKTWPCNSYTPRDRPL